MRRPLFGLTLAFAAGIAAAHALPLDAVWLLVWFCVGLGLAAALWTRRSALCTLTVVLAALFGIQLIFPSPEVRVGFAILYLVLSVGLAIRSPVRRRALLSLLWRA